MATAGMLVVGTTVLGLPAPALAAPGDAAARGLVVDLSAEVLGLTVISADATIGSATAPAGGGTDTSTLITIDLTGAVGVTASGTVEEVTATRGAVESSALSSVSGLNLSILGVDVLDATAVTATVTCPLVGAQTADTTLTGLELFGSAVTLTANGPAVTGSAAVTVAGLTDASLDVSLTRVETTTADGAAATTILAAVTLTGEVAGSPVTIPVGTVIVAEATCERPPTPAAPTAATIVPDSGPQSGGQTVTITGTDFVPDNTTVTFDGVPATDVVVDPAGTSLTAVTPPGAIGPAEVVVTTPGGSTDPLGYEYLADGSAAVVTGISPPSGPTSGGTTVTITGTGFTGAVAVDFNGLPSTDFTINPAGTTITVVSPPNPAGPATVDLIFPAGTVDAGTFTYVPPTITSIVPDEGPSTGGTTVTITGTGLTDATGVDFGGAAGTGLVVDPSGTSLTVVTPPGSPGPVDVTVEIPGENAVAVNGYTYLADPPTADTIAPDAGPQAGGQTVTITGTGFVPGATTVTFDGEPATDVVVDPAGTSLTAVTPPGAVGPASVVVTTPGGTAAPLDYTYRAAPVINAIDPDQGPTAGGTTVVVIGSGFVPGQTAVIICGRTIPADEVTVGDGGAVLTFRTPACQAGETAVSVATPGGVSNDVDFRFVGGSLPVTGTDLGPIVTAGSGLVLVGLLLLVLSRRRPGQEATG
ncbi:IPT/TIG domain-containing protein [Solwaraspora sp. WMMD1047]|uniref:IPT/TIG domain-containing protein n=1 Tax=Solwaraspora sp. WMMD1047 TaxID=3016102 RepID=UPI002416E833|nr:IPT/TIG domain-containing protein [Solwaraspora sp. WMMD1047]MDG4828697.1 IPT/TIG domain-containing protein [Solwaraspora sp. WMMD1047]